VNEPPITPALEQQCHELRARIYAAVRELLQIKRELRDIATACVRRRDPIGSVLDELASVGARIDELCGQVH
jgi:hypothetical protein